MLRLPSSSDTNIFVLFTIMKRVLSSLQSPIRAWPIRRRVKHKKQTHYIRITSVLCYICIMLHLYYATSHPLHSHYICIMLHLYYATSRILSHCICIMLHHATWQAYVKDKLDPIVNSCHRISYPVVRFLTISEIYAHDN